MKKYDNTKFDKQLEDMICELLHELPVTANEIVRHLQRLKEQEDACSSSTIKEKLDKNFQLAGNWFIDYSEMMKKLPEYLDAMNKSRQISFNSLMDSGNGVKDTMNTLRSASHGEYDEIILQYGEQQGQVFSALIKSHENSITLALLEELFIMATVYLSAATTEMILSQGQPDKHTPKKKTILELCKALVGAVPNVGTIISMIDLYKVFKALEESLCNGNVLHTNLQTADEQLTQIELQYSNLWANYEVLKGIEAYLDQCLSNALT